MVSGPSPFSLHRQSKGAIRSPRNRREHLATGSRPGALRPLLSDPRPRQGVAGRGRGDPTARGFVRAFMAS